jgi:3-deoxy-manno-octulosonate cytidylyltransferase (CMP-KDO synthetase)
MIQRVFENCTLMGASPSFDTQAYVVTDNQEIENHVKSFGGNVVRVDDDVASGTERIHLAFQKSSDKKFDLIINVQGDEPLITGSELERLVQFHLDSQFDIATLVKNNDSIEEFKNPNIVKAIVTPSGACLYFSRESIPHLSEEKEFSSWWQHIGVYSYRPKALQKFCESPLGVYEKVERLEQLRALEQGLSIGALVTNLNLIGVDTPEDIKKLTEVLSE